MLALLLLFVLATIKICILHQSFDEEYVVTLSCRILSEDRMFLDTWELHQMSGFLTAFLCWIYQALTGNTEYMVLYLYVCGTDSDMAIWMEPYLSFSFATFLSSIWDRYFGSS